jgi:hypothetical protein
MDRTLKRWLALALFMLSPAVMAAPCAPGTLADYIATGSCEVDGTTFAGFEELPVPNFATPIPAGDIQVTPLASAAEPGLQFTANAGADPGEFLSALFRFHVSGAGAYTAARASLSGAGATNDGVAILVEDLCLGDVFSPLLDCATGTLSLIGFADAFDSLLDPELAFAPSASFDVAANFLVDGGLAGTATLGGAALRFVTGSAATVPEPDALALMLSALALAAVRLRRRAPLHA